VPRLSTTSTHVKKDHRNHWTKIVILSEDFWEVGRYGDRLLNVYRAKAAREIGRGPRAGVLSPKALEAEISEWVDIIERAEIMLRLSPPLRRRHND